MLFQTNLCHFLPSNPLFLSHLWKKKNKVQAGHAWETTYKIFHFAEREVRQVAGVIAYPEEGGFLGQLGQVVENVLVDDGFGVAVGHDEFAARGLVAAGQAGPDVVGQGSGFGGSGGDFDSWTVFSILLHGGLDDGSEQRT